MVIPMYSHSLQQLLLSVFLILGILMNYQKYYIVVLVCVHLMANNFNHVMCLLIICTSSQMKCLLGSFVHLKNVLYVLYCKNCLIVLSVFTYTRELLEFFTHSFQIQLPLSDIKFASIFAHSLGCLFHLLPIVMSSTKVSDFEEVQLILVSCALISDLRNHCLT